MNTLKSISFTLLLLGVSAAGLTGCGGFKTTAPIPVPGVALHGRVHGGQQPVSGGTLQLYAAGSTGYGIGYNTGASSLIPTGSYYLGGVPGCVASASQVCYANVLTDTGGGFNITGDYVCPSATTEVYLVATGGSPGLPNNATNPQIALMAALGPCGDLSASTYISINELTTVASVWALAPFMSGANNVGTSSSNPTGLANAFASVNKLANITTGTASGPALPSGATAPVAKLNTLANILAACVNTAGGQAGYGDNTCGSLFRASTINGVAPTDTLMAALNIAQHPTLQTPALTALSVPASPFQPSLASPPNDYTLVVTYTGKALSAPIAAAVDASGDVWIANSGNSSVTELSNSGAALSGNNGYAIGSLNMPSAIAIDTSGNAWIANAGNNSISEISSAGTVAGVFTGGNLSSPDGVAIDQAGVIWIANRTGANITQIQPSGTVSSNPGPGGISPSAIAINPN